MVFANRLLFRIPSGDFTTKTTWTDDLNEINAHPSTVIEVLDTAVAKNKHRQTGGKIGRIPLGLAKMKYAMNSC